MNKEIREAVRDEIKRVDDAYWGLVDVLDVKASVVLVAVTFLGAVSGQLLGVAGLPMSVKVLQIASVALLAVDVVLILWCLWLKSVMLPPDPEETVKWVVKLEEYYAKDGEALLKEFDEKQQSAAFERIRTNKAATDGKTKLLGQAFWVLCGAIALDFVALGILAARMFCAC
jgi:uncharacterized membrane protein